MKLFVLCAFLLSAAAQAADEPQDPFIGALPDGEIKAMQGRLDPALAKAVAAAQKEQAPSSASAQSSSSSSQAAPVAPASPFQPAAPAYRSVNSAIMTAAFNEAQVPDCLHSEGLKRQPTFFLSGYLALPFIAVAKLRGKCL